MANKQNKWDDAHFIKGIAKLVPIIKANLGNYKHIGDVEKEILNYIGEEYFVRDELSKLANELVEKVAIGLAREAVIKTLWAEDNGRIFRMSRLREAFLRVVDIYASQPIAKRTLEKEELQQFSTPLPVAMLASVYVGDTDFYRGKRYFEPSAGNGALTVALPNSMCVTVNDIDNDRFHFLQWGVPFEECFQPYGLVTCESAADPDALRKYRGLFDGVITNPPFSKTIEKARPQDTYCFDEQGNCCTKGDHIIEVTNLGYAMGLMALSCMRDSGRAALIVGDTGEYAQRAYHRAKTEKRGYLSTPADRFFFNYLQYRYNIVDIMSIGGNLYVKNGTKFPIYLILIDGKRANVDFSKPLENGLRKWDGDDLRVIDDWGTLYNRMKRHIARNAARYAHEVINEVAEQTKHIL